MKLISITLHLQKMNEDLKILSQQIRRDILRMVHSANSGHPGGSLGCVEFFVILYKKVLKNDSKKDLNDIFILSNGHISPVYYSILARTGHFKLNELNTFRKINSRLQGHPTNHDGLPGINISSGSLADQAATLATNGLRMVPMGSGLPDNELHWVRCWQESRDISGTPVRRGFGFALDRGHEMEGWQRDDGTTILVDADTV